MLLGQIDIRPMPPQIDNPPQIPDVLHAQQKLSNMIQFPIGDVIDEARAIDGILRMEEVTRRAVIDDYHIRQLAIQQAQILDVIPLVEDATLAEEAGAYSPMGIEEVE